MSIRYKIFGVFSILIVLACGLAYYGIRGISTSGDLVVRLYDGPLMGINHARSAHASLNEARFIMQRGLVEGASSDTVAKFEKMLGSIFEDLKVVRDRVQSAECRRRLWQQAESRIRTWSDERAEDPEADVRWTDRDSDQFLAGAEGRRGHCRAG